MGNHISFGVTATSKVVYWDGSVQEIEEPVTVAELMLDHPQQVVVEFHSAVKNQKRPIPLPADKKLETKKTYVMVPVRRGKPVALSGEDCRRILFTVNNSSLHSNYLLCSSGFLPWLVRLFKTTDQTIAIGGTLQTKEDMEENKEEERFDFSEFLPEGGAEHMSRQLSGKGWKPSLDTIKEKKAPKRKLSRWLFLKNFTRTEI